MDGIVIIGHRSSKSTFGANKEDAGEADDYDNEDDALIIIVIIPTMIEDEDERIERLRKVGLSQSSVLPGKGEGEENNWSVAVKIEMTLMMPLELGL